MLATVETAWSYAAGVVPGKVYEYLASGRPVLGVGPPDGDAAFVLRDAGAGAMVAPDRDRIADVIRDHAQAWAAGTPRRGAPAEALGPYARPAQAGQVVGVVRRLSSAPTDPRP